jgi:hypothetical protein
VTGLVVASIVVGRTFGSGGNHYRTVPVAEAQPVFSAENILISDLPVEMELLLSISCFSSGV